MTTINHGTRLNIREFFIALFSNKKATEKLLEDKGLEDYIHVQDRYITIRPTIIQLLWKDLMEGYNKPDKHSGKQYFVQILKGRYTTYKKNGVWKVNLSVLNQELKQQPKADLEALIREERIEEALGTVQGKIKSKQGEIDQKREAARQKQLKKITEDTIKINRRTEERLRKSRESK